MHKPFIDRYAKIGRPKLAPDGEMNVSAQPLSRSLAELSKFDAQSRVVHAEIKRTRLWLNLKHVIGDRVSIKKKDAIKFAQWILKTYGK